MGNKIKRLMIVNTGNIRVSDSYYLPRWFTVDRMALGVTGMILGAECLWNDERGAREYHFITTDGHFVLTYDQMWNVLAENQENNDNKK